jgi:DNA polymerase III epsilon subunit-like protein
MNIIFLDTETTGASPERDRLIQLAYRVRGGKTVNELYNPGFPIAFESMAIHHITEDMVKSKPDFAASPEKLELAELSKDHVIVAHNAPFDMGFLRREGIFPKFVLDTFKVAYRYLREDPVGNRLSGHSLQYLRYALGLNEHGIVAHDALGDIIVLEKLFELLLNKVKIDENIAEDKAAVTQMINISNQPLLLRTIKFGKHRGKTFEEVLSEAPDYLQWLAGQTDLDENLKFTLNHYLRMLD